MVIEVQTIYVAEGPGYGVGERFLLGAFVDDLRAMHACEAHAKHTLDWVELQRGDGHSHAMPWAGGWRSLGGTTGRARTGIYTVTAQQLDDVVESEHPFAPAEVRAQDKVDHPHDDDCPRCGRRQWDDGEPATCRACGFVASEGGDPSDPSTWPGFDGCERCGGKVRAGICRECGHAMGDASDAR